MENVKKIIEEKKRILDDIQRNGYFTNILDYPNTF